jgi:hypothetical protein
MLRTCFGLFAAFLALATSTKNQSAPTIKGHAIGETVGQFFAKEPELQRELERCQAIAASQHVTENDVIHSKLARELKDSYREWARQNELYNYQGAFTLLGIPCELKLSAVSLARADISPQGYLHDDPANPPKLDGTWTFDEGRLVRLVMPVEASYEIAFAELVAKFGAVTNEKRSPYQNGFGARWEDSLVEWDTPEVYVALYQDRNPVALTAMPMLLVESRQERDAQLKQLSPSKSALD